MLPQSKSLRGIRPKLRSGQDLASQERIYCIRTFISGQSLIFFFRSQPLHRLLNKRESQSYCGEEAARPGSWGVGMCPGSTSHSHCSAPTVCRAYNKPKGKSFEWQVWVEEKIKYRSKNILTHTCLKKIQSGQDSVLEFSVQIKATLITIQIVSSLGSSDFTVQIKDVGIFFTETVESLKQAGERWNQPRWLQPEIHSYCKSQF